MKISDLKELKNSHYKAILITLLLRVIGVLTLFGFTLFLTNNYSPEIVGNFEFIRVFVLVISSFSILGLDQSIYQLIGNLKAEKGFEKSLFSLYQQILKVLIITSFIVIGLFILFPKNWILNFYSNDLIIYNYITKSIFLVFFYSLTIVNTEFIRGIGLINLSEIFRNFLKFAPVILGSILLVNYEDKIRIIDFYLVGFVFLSIISSFIVLNKLKEIEKQSSVSNKFIHFSVKEIAKKSYPMAISGFCFFVMLSIDIFLLKRYYSDAIVAYYSVAIKFLTILSLVIIAINVNVSPKISELYFSDKIKDLLDLLIKSKWLIIIINWSLGLILLVFGKFLLSFFGEEYIQAYAPMAILIIGQMMASLFGSVAVVLNMIGKQLIFQRILIASTLINIVSNIILIPKFGMNGAAISFVIASFFWNCISYLYLKKYLQTNSKNQ